MASHTATGVNRPDLVNVEDLRKQLEAQEATASNWPHENDPHYASTTDYFLPTDEPEIQRLNKQHWILTQAKGGNIYNAPVSADHKDFKILDIGCGSGVWCLQMAERFPSAKVVGMDTSPMQPTERPANVEWVMLDMQTVWPFPNDHFHFIHLSLVHGCVADWSEMMLKIEQHLAPGGYVEHQEFSICRPYILDTDGNKIPLPSDINKLPPFLRWSRLMEQAAERRGRILQLGPKLVELQSSASLQDVTQSVYALSIGTWPTDQQQKFVGGHMLLNGLQGVDGFTTLMFTQALGWTLEATRDFIKEVKKDLCDDSMRKVMDLHVVYGRKPDTAYSGRV